MPPQAARTDAVAEFAADVRAGLTRADQKELPSKYFYDEIGSALFEVITLLPEYGLTRADEHLLERHAAEMAARTPLPVVVTELGSGSGKKSRRILEELARHQSLTYYPIDISRASLDLCERELGAVDGVGVVGLEKTYLEGLREAAARRPQGAHLMVLFLGSTLGNFERPAAEEFLRAVRQRLLPGDSLLLSADLEKSVPRLLAAYDDSLGVTAAFNLNLLARINRELEADFALSQFRHVARYNWKERRIEMHLRAVIDHTVTIPRANLTVPFRQDETIWTECSHKFTPTEVVQLAGRAGFRCEGQWVDEEWPFAQSLLIAR